MRNAKGFARYYRFSCGLALGLAVLVQGPAIAADPAHCIRADVPFAWNLENGPAQDPGVVRICLTRNMSPVQGLHSIAVDGMTIGAYPSRTGRAEGSGVGEAFLLFKLQRDSVYALEGYVVSVSDRWRSYRLTRESPDFDKAGGGGQIRLAAAFH